MSNPTEKESAIRKLEQEVAKAAAADDFFNSDGGKLAKDYLEKRATFLIDKLSSKEFVSDHEGYLDARAALQEIRGLLDFLRATQTKGKSSSKQLEEIRNG